MIVAQNDVAEGQQSAGFRDEAAAAGLVARLRLRAFDPKALGLDGGASAESKEADIAIVAQNDVAEGQQSALSRDEAAAAGLVAGLRLRTFDPKALGLDGGARTESEKADVVVFTEPRTAQGQRGAVLRLDSAALGLVARLRLRAFDPKALGLDGGARADGEEADFLVFLEPRNAQGQRGALLRLHSAASGLIAGVRLRAFDPKAFGLDGGARTEGE